MCPTADAVGWFGGILAGQMLSRACSSMYTVGRVMPSGVGASRLFYWSFVQFELKLRMRNS